MTALSPEQHVELKELVEKHGLNPYFDRIDRAAQSAIQLLTLEPDDYSQVGSTRFGGLPDLPDDIEWPSAGNIYMTFLAQIKLAQMPSLDQCPLPGSGWLYFFLVEGENAD